MVQESCFVFFVLFIIANIYRVVAGLGLCVRSYIVIIFQTLEEVFVVIFRYFILEGWYLVLEQQVFFSYIFSFVFVKFLVGYFSVGVLQLLMVSVSIFRNIGQLGFLVRYLEVIIQSVLKELRIRRAGFVTLLLKILLQFEVLQGLYLYMEDVQFREVILVLLILFEVYLVVY